mgnify:CR=1 FL=1
MDTIYNEASRLNEKCDEYIKKHPAKAIEIIESWSQANPLKTQMSEFLKMFPNAKINEEDGFPKVNRCGLGLDCLSSSSSSSHNRHILAVKTAVNSFGTRRLNNVSKYFCCHFMYNWFNNVRNDSILYL